MYVKSEVYNPNCKSVCQLNLQKKQLCSVNESGETNYSYHGIIGVRSPPPYNFRSPLDTKVPGLSWIYLVGLLAILDPYINICVGPPNTCIALKQFYLLPPNTLYWSNFIYYHLTHQFEAITLGSIKTCVKWFWDNFDWDW